MPIRIAVVIAPMHRPVYYAGSQITSRAQLMHSVHILSILKNFKGIVSLHKISLGQCPGYSSIVIQGITVELQSLDPLFILM